MEDIIWKAARDGSAGMTYLHAQDIIHRDLTPANMLIRKIEARKLQVKIADFGISRKRTLSAIDSKRSYRSFAYAAPEVLSASMYHVQFESDVFSFGRCLLHAMTGIRPYNGKTKRDVELSFETSREDIPKAPKQSKFPQLNSIVDACLRKEPSGRPAFRQLERSIETAYASLMDRNNLKFINDGDTKAAAAIAWKRWTDLRYLTMPCQSREMKPNIGECGQLRAALTAGKPKRCDILDKCIRECFHGSFLEEKIDDSNTWGVAKFKSPKQLGHFVETLRQCGRGHDVPEPQVDSVSHLPCTYMFVPINDHCRVHLKITYEDIWQIEVQRQNRSAWQKEISATETLVEPTRPSLRDGRKCDRSGNVIYDKRGASGVDFAQLDDYQGPYNAYVIVHEPPILTNHARSHEQKQKSLDRISSALFQVQSQLGYVCVSAADGARDWADLRFRGARIVLWFAEADSGYEAVPRRSGDLDFQYFVSAVDACNVKPELAIVVTTFSPHARVHTVYMYDTSRDTDVHPPPYPRSEKEGLSALLGSQNFNGSLAAQAR